MITKNDIVNEIVTLIERNLLRKSWLYYPPGPMAGQIFDKKRCHKDIEHLVNELFKGLVD